MRVRYLGPLQKEYLGHKPCGVRSDAPAHTYWLVTSFSNRCTSLQKRIWLMHRHGELCADGARAEILLQRGLSMEVTRPRRGTPSTRRCVTTFVLRMMTRDKLWRSLHEGSRASRNFHRRYFRDDSDVSSCTSLSSSEAASR